MENNSPIELQPFEAQKVILLKHSSWHHRISKTKHETRRANNRI